MEDKEFTSVKPFFFDHKNTTTNDANEANKTGFTCGKPIRIIRLIRG